MRENGSKKGENDKRCILEVRLKNKQPIAVTSDANTIEKSVDNGLKKLKSLMDKSLRKH